MSNALMSTHAEFSSSDRRWSFRLQGQAAALSAILCVGLSSRDGFPEQEIGVALAVARTCSVRVWFCRSFHLLKYTLNRCSCG